LISYRKDKEKRNKLEIRGTGIKGGAYPCRTGKRNKPSSNRRKNQGGWRRRFSDEWRELAHCRLQIRWERERWAEEEKKGKG